MNLPLELWDLHFLLTWFYLESIKEKVQCSLYDLRFVYSLLPDLRRHWRFSVYCVAGLLLWRRKAAAEGRVPVSVFLKHTSDYEYLSRFEVLNEKDWNFTRIWICSCFKSFFKVFLRQKKEKVLIWLVLGEALYLIPTLVAWRKEIESAYVKWYHLLHNYWHVFQYFALWFEAFQHYMNRNKDEIRLIVSLSTFW